MADEMFDLLDKIQEEGLQRSRTFLADSPHSFLDRVITPIHKILAAVRSADHLHLVCFGRIISYCGFSIYATFTPE
jgi:hypothetical protein